MGMRKEVNACAELDAGPIGMHVVRGEDKTVSSHMRGEGIRGRFIIDPDGVIQAMEVLTPPVGRHPVGLIRQIQAFQLVRESRGAKATPSGWTPGDDVLELGPDMVGKVWKAWKP